MDWYLTFISQIYKCSYSKDCIFVCFLIQHNSNKMKGLLRVKLVTLLILLTCTQLLTAQQKESTSFQIQGILLDSITRQGEPYATIKVARKESPQKAVKMLVSDMNGKFKERVPGSGSFLLTITSVGRTTITRPFTASQGEKLIDFGTMLVSDASNELGQIEVVAQKPLVKADVDKIEYNIQDDPDSQSNSLLEMLRKVPLVTVDGEDNIKVNGSSSFKVYVNGRPNNMMSNNPTEVLKSMPANSIKHIEVITNPGPKYDAEGVGGILNIVTVGSGMEGYTATFSGNVSNNGGGGSLFSTVQKGKLTVSARYNYDYSKQPKSHSGGTRTTLPERLTEHSSDVLYENSNKGNHRFHAGSLEASYEIDTLRLVSMSFGLWGGGYRGDRDGHQLGSHPSLGELYEYATVGRTKNSWFSIDGGIDYQRLFHTKNRMLTFSYKINTNPSTSDDYTDYVNKTAVPEWEDFIHRLTNLHTDGKQHTTEHTFQVDYTTPIGKLHTIEGGVKYILRDNAADNDRYEQTSDSPEADYAFDEEYSSHYKHQNDILAAYLGYGLKWKKLSGRLGLRYEFTHQEVKYLLGKGEDFQKDFNDLVPSASIGYQLTDLSNLRLGYNMRIYRPGIWYLNPYLDDSNPSNLSQGNPNLNSEKSHNLNLSYSNFTQKFNLNVGIHYSFTNNSIEHVNTLMQDTEIPGLQNPTGKEVLYSTYYNMGKNRTVGLNGYVNWNATSNTRLYLNINGSYVYIKGAENLKNDGWTMFAFGGIQQTLPKDWRISLNLMGQTPWIMLQGKGSRFFDYSLSVNKSFLKKRLTLSAYASNFFKKYKRNSSHLEDVNFVQDSYNRYTRQRFGFSISYRIGELKASVKKAARSISNDDVKGGEGSSGGEGH